MIFQVKRQILLSKCREREKHKDCQKTSQISSGKAYVKRRFTKWYNTSISGQLDKGKVVEDIDVKLNLSIFKPIHAEWIKNFIDYLTPKEGGKIFSIGMKAAFITEAIEKGSKPLDSVNPFYEVDPLTSEMSEMFEVIPANQDDFCNFATRSIDDYGNSRQNR